MNKTIPIILIVLIVLCCCLIIVLGAVGIYAYNNLDGISFTPTEAPLPPFTPVTESVTTETLETLENTIIPVSDLLGLACRLDNKCNIPKTSLPPAAPLTVGTLQTFWASDTSNDSHFQVEAILRYVTPHSYFWVEDGVIYDEQDMKDLMDTFEEKMYPTNRKYFGSEWTPGVDGDEHIYVLYLSGIGFNVAGYYSSIDEYLPQAMEYSNGHEIFYFNADNSSLNDEYTYSTLAHEFQHMIQWYQDSNEEGWLNEGYSELATYFNGYGAGGWDSVFLSDPDLQLNTWVDINEGESGAHYGASFLFTMYFLERFGEETTRALIANPANGFDGIDATLAELDITDPLTGQLITADDVFMDWVITNTLQDGSVADGRYTYKLYDSAPQASETETISTCPLAMTGRSVHQYAADYIRITCDGDHNLHFDGYPMTKVAPTDPHSGNYFFWSNKNDVSNMNITREFDFSAVSGPITLTYWTWYDLEEDYDYVFLESSMDGVTWKILITPSGTPDDPSGNSYGWGYNGKSGGWIQESVDISQFAGQKIRLRFEYVTDAMVTGDGFFLDDISVPEIGYSSDLEGDSGGWEAEGFVRIQNILPQTFRLALIKIFDSVTTVEMIPVSEFQSADILFNIGQDGLQEVILVVSGTTRFTRESAPYQFEIR